MAADPHKFMFLGLIPSLAQIPYVPANRESSYLTPEQIDTVIRY